jgi:uncharacterized protein
MIADPKVLERLCRTNDITTLRIFGSAARGEASAESDIDLLAEFGSPVSLMDLVGVEQAFEEELGRKVDLLTPRALSPHIRDRVLSEARVLYARPGR